MKLVVLNVAYPFAPVGSDALGNAEQLLTRLDAALARNGHESFVMACEGSATEGILLATPKPLDLRDQAERHRIHEQYRFTLQSFLEKWPIDLIHMHGTDFYEYLPSPGVPVLATLHLPVDHYPEKIFHLDRPQTFLQCVSAQQRNACPPCPYLLPEIGSNSAEGPAEMIHATRLLDAGGVHTYFSIYERLVSEARTLAELTRDFSEPHLAAETAHV
jgi:hypothetical protein